MPRKTRNKRQLVSSTRPASPEAPVAPIVDRSQSTDWEFWKEVVPFTSLLVSLPIGMAGLVYADRRRLAAVLYLIAIVLVICAVFISLLLKRAPKWTWLFPLMLLVGLSVFGRQYIEKIMEPVHATVGPSLSSVGGGTTPWFLLKNQQLIPIDHLAEVVVTNNSASSVQFDRLYADEFEESGAHEQLQSVSLVSGDLYCVSTADGLKKAARFFIEGDLIQRLSLPVPPNSEVKGWAGFRYETYRHYDLNHIELRLLKDTGEIVEVRPAKDEDGNGTPLRLARIAIPGGDRVDLSSFPLMRTPTTVSR